MIPGRLAAASVWNKPMLGNVIPGTWKLREGRPQIHFPAPRGDQGDRREVLAGRSSLAMNPGSPGRSGGRASPSLCKPGSVRRHRHHPCPHSVTGRIIGGIIWPAAKSGASGAERTSWPAGLGSHSAVSLLPEDAPNLLFVTLKKKKKSFQAREIIKPS